MSIEVSPETEARLSREAQRQGISVDVLWTVLMRDSGATAHALREESTPKLPILHLGAMSTYAGEASGQAPRDSERL
jgi:hypothetical protein